MITRTAQAKQELEKITEDNFLVVVDEYDNEYAIECIKRHNICSDNPYNFCYAFKINTCKSGCIKR